MGRAKINAPGARPRRWIAWAGIHSSLTGRYRIKLRVWGGEAAEIRRACWADYRDWAISRELERYEVVTR